jgi:hypothetical protein
VKLTTNEFNSHFELGQYTNVIFKVENRQMRVIIENLRPFSPLRANFISQIVGSSIEK